MTLWFCDRCGKQVPKDSYGAGKYDIQKSFCEETVDEYGFSTELRQGKRYLKFCGNCAAELEKFLDDEFAQVPAELVGKKNKEG